MLMPASSEFIALCRSQVALLTNGLGAVLSIIYLTEELTDATDTKLVPIVVYPEVVSRWEEEQIFSLLFQAPVPDPIQDPSRILPSSRLLSGDISAETPTTSDTFFPSTSEPETDRQPLQIVEKALLQQQQVVLPLMHQDVVMGLLVTARADRPWNESEQTQIEQIADTLAIACLLDQRAQWLSQDLRQQHLLREQKHDLFDNLLHQFRNPLTALRTFGKLLVKRLQPGDTNRSVAEGIVRESDRLQELLQQFDAAVDLDEIGLRRLLSAAEEIERNESGIEENSDYTENRTENRKFVAALGQSTPTETLPQAQALLPSANRLVGTLAISTHAIAEVLEPLLETAGAIAQDRQLTLTIHIPPHLPLIQIDVRALREVLNNLLDNALKYTPAGGQITVEIQSQPLPDRPHQQVIIIADTGPGIPAQDLVHLFERHYRGVQAATDIPGTGLGLAIARELVQQMQGDIQIFSPAQTCGLLQQFPGALTAKFPGTAVVVWLPEQKSASN